MPDKSKRLLSHDMFADVLVLENNEMTVLLMDETFHFNSAFLKKFSPLFHQINMADVHVMTASH